MKEKDIENAIYEYLKLRWAVVEKLQGWKVLIAKWKYKHMMTLQSEWACDITCFYRWEYIWIEVKKDQKEIGHWLKQEKRFYSWEKIPKSYKREEYQIKYKQKILKNFWTFILTCELKEVIDYILEMDEKSKK